MARALLSFLLIALSFATPSAAAEKPGWRTAEINGVRWLIDPAGNPFYSRGVNMVSPNKETDKSRTGKAYYWANFYPSLEDWREDTARRVKEWGFNTLGGWSDSSPDLGLALTAHIGIGRQAGFHWLDPFGPDIEQKAMERAGTLTAPYKDLPHLIGYYSDNEVGWWNAPLFKWYLREDWGNHTKQLLWKIIFDHYGGDWRKFLVDWVPQEGICGFEDLKKTDASLKLRPEGFGIRVVDKFLRAYTGRYYELMHKVIRAAHPGALVMGDRLPLYYHQDAVLAIGDNLDVISTNYNVDVGDGWVAPYFFDGLRKLSDKPVLVTEFFFAAEQNQSGNRNESAGKIDTKPGHLMTVETQSLRTLGAGAALLNFAGFSNVVGAHWFQYFDEPQGGRDDDGEDYNMGLVDIANKPYEELTEGFRKLNAALPAVHAQSVSGTKPGAEVQPDGSVLIERARNQIGLKDQSLIEWEKAKTLLSGFSVPEPYVPFGDVHLTWRPEGFYLFSISNTYVDPNFLDYRGSFPRSEAFQLHFTLEAAGKTGHYAGFLIPQINPAVADGFEVFPELFRMEGGKPVERMREDGHLQKFNKALPHVTIEAFFPANWFGLDELKAGMRFKSNIALVSYFREFAMAWAGGTEMKEISNPSAFREIVLTE
ncbi:MAG: hypothetical protein LLG06_13220 [Desulfobacteraceae bacterium]|nr:hypothetical protein [Desulfobacteraceae bacterium]